MQLCLPHGSSARRARSPGAVKLLRCRNLNHSCRRTLYGFQTTGCPTASLIGAWFAGSPHPRAGRSIFSDTTNKCSHEVRQRAVRLVLNNAAQHPSRCQLLRYSHSPGQRSLCTSAAVPRRRLRYAASCSARPSCAQSDARAGHQASPF